jgi:hypothetical protein
MPCVYLPGPAPAVTVANSNDMVFNVENLFNDGMDLTLRRRSIKER